MVCTPWKPKKGRINSMNLRTIYNQNNNNVKNNAMEYIHFFGEINAGSMIQSGV